MERESIPHDGNSQQSFATLPLKPNGQRKTRVRTTESHLIQQSPGMNRLREFPADPSGTRHCSQIDGDMHPVDQNLGASWNPRTAVGGDRIRAGGPRSTAASPKTGPQIPQGEPGDPVPSTSLPPRDRGRSCRPSKAHTTAPIRHAAAAAGAPEEPPRHGAGPHHTPARSSRPAPIHRVRGRGGLPCRRRRPGFARPRPGAAGEEKERWGGRRLAAARVFPSPELVRLQAYLKDADSKWRSGNARVTVLVSQIRDVAYEAQNVIEAADYMEKRNRLKRGFMGAISRYARLPSDLVTLLKIGVEIQCVRRKLADIFTSADNLKIDLGDTVVVDDQLPRDFSVMHQNSEDDIFMVGFQDEHNEIVGKLVDNESMLSAVSIVAMGGAGKTTLARKVYTSSRVKKHFNTVAWVTVSQTFKGVDLLKDIMKQITESKDCSREIDEMDEYQLGKKIRDFLLQKRYLVVLDDVWETDTWEHWELFSSKALPSYKRSVIDDVDEFEKLGRKLAKKCDGLPLALAVLGGHLSKNLNRQTWSYVLSGWPSTKDTQMMRDILARSYKDLSSHYLKSCFLYLAAFPEDFEISVSHLIQLWIAENFIPHISNHKPEETARMYVTELAQRSLVQVVQRSKVHGWIEKIRIHDILREWCIEEARKDGFLAVENETTGQASASSSDTLKFYRSSLQNSGYLLLETRHLRTLVGFELQFIPKMSFLRVLHIENSNLMGICRVIDGCINIRYLRLRRCYNFKVTSSITKLLYLQTIDLRGTYYIDNRKRMPKFFLHIPSLRHVYIRGFSRPRSVQQNDLQTLSIEYCFNREVKFLSQMTKLTTLSFFPAWDVKDNWYIFANMPHLVDVSIGCFQEYTKYSGHNIVIKGDPIAILEKLPCLVVLKLEGFKGEIMSCSAQGFPQLRELLLRRCSSEWSMEDGTMPKLSFLTLLDFGQMSRLPEGLLQLPSLKCLKISGEDSAVKELQQKGCQVALHLLPSLHFLFV
nr:NBS-LRR disease resistance protein [Dasypyrum villosum]